MKETLSKFFHNENFNLCFISFVTSLVMLPVLFNGLPNGHDMPHHFQCAFTFYESLINGDLYPSWSLFRNMGYGGMVIRLYPPISHYTLALFYLFTNDWHIATWLALTLFTILGSYGIYLWARELMSAPQAVFAACIYAFLPYHLTQVYTAFFYAEFAGSAILPFCFAFVTRVCNRGKFSDIIGLAIAYAALILTHLPLTVIGSICLSIYALSFFDRKKFFSMYSKLVVAVLIALAGSSFFWVKVFQERDLLAKTSVYSDPWYNYRLHFLLTPFQTFEGFHLEIYENALSFYDLMFLCATGLALCCTLPFIFTSKSKRNLHGVWFVFATSVFLATPFSRFVWDRLLFLQEVQFPWRWLIIVSITASILSASHLDLLVVWFRGKKRPLALIIGGSILAVITFSISQVIRPAPFVEKSKIQSWIQNNQKAEGFIFWLTPWTRKEIFNITEKVLAEDRNVQIENWTATDREFQVLAGEAENARVAVFYHPNWKAAVNNSPVEIKIEENGAVLIPLPNQKSDVKLFFEETFAVHMGRLLSAFTWLGILLFLISRLNKQFFVNNYENNQ